MNAADLFTTAGIPLAELAATSDDPDIAPPDFILRFVDVALATPDQPMTDRAVEMVTEWAATQRPLAAQAATVLHALHTRHPYPQPTDLLASPAQFPAWAAHWWAVTLRFPWAGRLDTAIDAAHIWLDTHG